MQNSDLDSKDDLTARRRFKALDCVTSIVRDQEVVEWPPNNFALDVHERTKSKCQYQKGWTPEVESGPRCSVFLGARWVQDTGYFRDSFVP